MKMQVILRMINILEVTNIDNYETFDGLITHNSMFNGYVYYLKVTK